MENTLQSIEIAVWLIFVVNFLHFLKVWLGTSWDITEIRYEMEEIKKLLETKK